MPLRIMNCLVSRVLSRRWRRAGWLVGLSVALLGFGAGCKRSQHSAAGDVTDQFLKLSQEGRNLVAKGQPEKALAVLGQALELNPTSLDARLNLAVANLLANQPSNTLFYARQVIEFDPNNGAAHYLAGCAYLHMGQPKEAIKALQEAKRIDRTVNAVSFQLGRAYRQAGLYEEAAAEFQELLTFQPEHRAAHYALSQVLLRLGRTQEAQQELAEHQRLNKDKKPLSSPFAFELCKYTEIRVPFKPEVPQEPGIAVRFTDATAEAFAGQAQRYRGPADFIDFAREGRNHLFVIESNAFRVLINSNGVFHPTGHTAPAEAEGAYRRCLVGDLNNDRIEDVMLLGERDSRVLKFATNGMFMDLTLFSKFKGVQAADGLLADLDFTGKLDVLLNGPGTNGVRVLRNLGNPYFMEYTTNSGLPVVLTGVRQMLVEDWNNDDLLDVIFIREGQPPQLYARQRGGPLVATNALSHLPEARAAATGDLNNDLRADMVLATDGQLRVIFNGLGKDTLIELAGWPVARLMLVDYDNDGWLDLWALGHGLRVWRNLGPAGFKETTQALGLDKLDLGAVRELAPADTDNDGDTDLLLTLESGELRLLRNDGGNANRQLKVQLVGTKSNASGLGIRLEVSVAGLRVMRRVQRLPVEIGVGQHAKVDSITAHWFDFSLNSIDVAVNSQTPLPLLELQMDTGSCPYFYAWDGKTFRFVSDFLGAAPLGLPVSDDRYVEADPIEYVWIGDESMFPPRDGSYVLQLTEELREVLYLDEAKLVVADHPADTVVYPTCKMVPGRPFPPHNLITLHRPRTLLRAVNHEGTDVTELLRAADGRHASPTRRRIPHYKGLAEPSSVTLDFGPLEPDRPWVLAMTGWVRFGGATANLAASHNPELPFPFPVLEAETAPGKWRQLDVVVGTPAGKTKRMIVDLTGKLPSRTLRLRLSTAFELHWDQIGLFEKALDRDTRITPLTPDRTDLHWRGFSRKVDEPWTLPVRPVYAELVPYPYWRHNVMGWCTRYGPVDELVASQDNALCLVNAGDELTLEFDAKRLPPKPPGYVRDFFLYAVGWDKDADVHCAFGWQVEPLPWHGMDDQQYGRQPRPALEADNVMQRYNTRWVGARSLTYRAPR